MTRRRFLMGIPLLALWLLQAFTFAASQPSLAAAGAILQQKSNRAPTAVGGEAGLLPSISGAAPGVALAGDLSKGWTFEVVDSAGDVGGAVSLELDTSGRPRISYYDRTNGALKYAYHDGTTWRYQVVDTGLGQYVGDTSLELDSAGRPRISYRDHAHGDLKYASFDGTNWHTETVDSAGDVGHHTSLDLDSADRPHISHLNYSSNDLKHGWHDGANWHVETVDSTGDVGWSSSLALDTFDRPHISYFDRSHGALKYASYDGSAWRFETVDNVGEVGRGSSLALDASGYPHISYCGWTNYVLKYAHFDGTQWTRETLDNIGRGESTSLVLDNAGLPHVSYYDYANGDLKYAHFDGSDWQFEIVDGGGNVGQWSSLALDAAGQPHIAYYDVTNGDLKYASLGGALYSISGSVTDTSGDPILGATISDEVGHATTTDANGDYVLTRLDRGSYALTVSKVGYVFSPASTCAEVPPDVTGKDFTGGPLQIEINQGLGIQDCGAQNYVAGKNTAVRVLLAESREVNPASQHLVVYRGGTYVNTLYPSESPGTKTDKLTFLCPGSSCSYWAPGSYSFTASVDGFTAQTAAVFQVRKTLRMLAVPITVRDWNSGMYIHLPDNQWRTAGEFLRRVYPIGSFNLEWVLADEFYFDLNVQTKSGREWLWWGLSTKNWFCGLPGFDRCYDAIIGFIPPMAIDCDPSGDCSTGWTFGAPATVVMANGDYTDPYGHPRSVQGMQVAVAHEVGHMVAKNPGDNLGDEYDDFQHCAGFQCSVNPAPASYRGRKFEESSCDAEQCNDLSVIDWGLGYGSKVTADRAHPYDVGQRKLIDKALSFMGAAGLHPNLYWVTRDAYKQLFVTLAPSAQEQGTLQEPEPLVLASGWIGRDDSLSTDPWYILTGTLEAVVTGTYTIEAVDAMSQTLASQGFEISWVAMSNPPVDMDPAPFSVRAPAPEGTAAFRIKHGDAVLGTVTLSPHAPTVAITAPVAGELISGVYTVTWESGDLDGDTLYHTLEYSPDGQGWQVLTANITQTLFAADFDQLPGGDAAQVRVTVSDEVNTAQATSLGFVVATKPPEAFIFYPSSGDMFAPGSTVTLNGSAYDRQEGWLRSDEALVWSSDRDEVLGNGEIVYLDDLSYGKHVITLTATSGLGQSGSTSITLFIENRLYLPLVTRTH